MADEIGKWLDKDTVGDAIADNTRKYIFGKACANGKILQGDGGSRGC